MVTEKLSHLLRIGTSVPVLTLLIIILMEVVLRQVDIPDELGFRSADIGNLAPRLEEARKTCPDVCFVGSSQVLVLNRTDWGREFYGGHPRYFQQILSDAVKENVVCLNMGTDLQMVSEAYLISQAVANNRCRPAVIIYGIAFREFIQDAYALEWLGENFNCVAPYVPITPAILGTLYSWDAMKELTLAHYCYLYRDRLGFKNMLTAFTKNWLDTFMPMDEPFPRLAPPFLSYVPNKQGFLYEQWIPRKMDVEDAYKANPEAFNLFFYNLQAGIYPGDHELAQKIQGKYFLELIDLCSKKNIKLVIVDMPLSEKIRKLPSPGMYEAFQKFLKEGADHKVFALIDLYGDSEFSQDSAFKDGVHLNVEKSKALADRIVSELKSKYPEIITAIKEHAAKEHGQETHQ